MGNDRQARILPYDQRDYHLKLRKLRKPVEEAGADLDTAIFEAMRDIVRLPEAQATQAVGDLAAVVEQQIEQRQKTLRKLQQQKLARRVAARWLGDSLIARPG